MLYREYGNTGVKVSALGFGAMRFETPRDHDKSVATVLRAFEKGITYFDTAPGYCEDQSELIIGKAVKEMKKSGKPFYISTKSMRSSAGGLRAQLEESLKRLNVDSIDFYNCWYVLTKEDWEKRKSGGAVAEILKARDEGLIKHAAFSTHLPGEEIRDVIEEGFFEGVTLGYSAINFPYREDGIQAAHERGMGVVIMNPLGGGLITADESAFEFLKVHSHQSVLEGALHFLLTDPRITLPLVGFRHDADVDSAVAAVENFVPYSSDELAELKGKIQGEFNTLCTACRYCKDCPEDIPVWAFVETVNFLLIHGHMDIMDRLKNFWGVDPSDMDRCTQCLQCESACTQHLPIMERFEILKKALAQ
jgi:hypothetical protein